MRGFLEARANDAEASRRQVSYSGRALRVSSKAYIPVEVLVAVVEFHEPAS